MHVVCCAAGIKRARVLERCLLVSLLVVMTSPHWSQTHAKNPKVNQQTGQVYLRSRARPYG